MTRHGRAIRPAVCADSIRQAVGVSATFEMATELIRPGGTVANVGGHGTSAELKLQDLWIKDVAITTGLVSATTTPMLLRLVARHASDDQLDAASWCHHLVPEGSVYVFLADHRHSCSRLSCSPMLPARVCCRPWKVSLTGRRSARCGAISPGRSPAGCGWTTRGFHPSSPGTSDLARIASARCRWRLRV
jgi:hypothetical protein